MEQVRNARLDHFCEDIHESRQTMNQARLDEQAAIGGALSLMHERGTSIYKHAGIELARVPGTEKLRVRVIKEQGDAEVGTGDESAENAGEGAGEEGSASAEG